MHRIILPDRCKTKQLTNICKNLVAMILKILKIDINLVVNSYISNVQGSCYWIKRPQIMEHNSTI